MKTVSTRNLQSRKWVEEVGNLIKTLSCCVKCDLQLGMSIVLQYLLPRIIGWLFFGSHITYYNMYNADSKCTANFANCSFQV